MAGVEEDEGDQVVVGAVLAEGLGVDVEDPALARLQGAGVGAGEWVDTGTVAVQHLQVQ